MRVGSSSAAAAEAAAVVVGDEEQATTRALDADGILPAIGLGDRNKEGFLIVDVIEAAIGVADGGWLVESSVIGALLLSMLCACVGCSALVDRVVSSTSGSGC
jgi:hypothetical protein